MIHFRLTAFAVDAMDAKDEETRKELEEAGRKLQEEMQRIDNESRNLVSNFQKEREEFEQRMRQMDAEAKRELERMNEQSRLEIAELERQRHSDTSLSGARLEELLGKIAELEALHRDNGGWLRTAGVVGLNLALLAVYPPLMRAVFPPPVVAQSVTAQMARMASRALAAVV